MINNINNLYPSFKKSFQLVIIFTILSLHCTTSYAEDMCLQWEANLMPLFQTSGTGKLQFSLSDQGNGRFLVLGTSSISMPDAPTAIGTVPFMGFVSLINDRFILSFTANHDISVGTDLNYMVSANGIISLDSTTFKGNVKMVVPLVNQNGTRENPLYASGSAEIVSCQ